MHARDSSSSSSAVGFTLAAIRVSKACVTVAGSIGWLGLCCTNVGNRQAGVTEFKIRHDVTRARERTRAAAPLQWPVCHLDLRHRLGQELEHLGGRGGRGGGAPVQLDIPADVGEPALEQTNNLRRHVRNARPCPGTRTGHAGEGGGAGQATQQQQQHVKVEVDPETAGMYKILFLVLWRTDLPTSVTTPERNVASCAGVGSCPVSMRAFTNAALELRMPLSAPSVWARCHTVAVVGVVQKRG